MRDLYRSQFLLVNLKGLVILQGMKKTEDTPSFETSLKELEKIVSQLEAGDTPLETQLKAFEKGVAISRDCLKQLEAIEQKVELLMQNPEGELTTAPFDVSPKSP